MDLTEAFLRCLLSERVAVSESSTRMQQMTLHGLEKYQNYSVQVVASTRVGSGLKSRSIYCTTKEDRELLLPVARPTGIIGVNSCGLYRMEQENWRQVARMTC